METSPDTLFVALEYDKNLPKLDLHGTKPKEVENAVFNFLLEQINLGEYKAQIIYGRGGSGVLRNKAKEFLNKNMAEPNPVLKLVKAWKESSLADAGGRCLILLESA
ncbi:MAG: Smr/MutS family protein [Candidatus Magasanikbacteria bacterium]|nr:Smr/MutS family protein [Candidatus Magasanikbacteria bacterium]